MSRRATFDDVRGKPTLSMTGLLAVEMVIGYEWLISGLLKFVRGDFPSVRRTVLLFTAAAPIGGAFLAINLHLANGASHP